MVANQALPYHAESNKPRCDLKCFPLSFQAIFWKGIDHKDKVAYFSPFMKVCKHPGALV